jgi:hypothetical protein
MREGDGGAQVVRLARRPAPRLQRPGQRRQFLLAAQTGANAGARCEATDFDHPLASQNRIVLVLTPSRAASSRTLSHSPLSHWARLATSGRERQGGSWSPAGFYGLFSGAILRASDALNLMRGRLPGPFGPIFVSVATSWASQRRMVCVCTR